MHILFSALINTIAASDCTGSKISGSCLPQPGVGQSEVSAILEIAFGIIGAFALLVITVSGMRYITSGGNPEKTAKAKNGIVYSLVGLVVAITAEAIVAFVVNRL